MKIYFAHPTNTYNSDIEIQSINLIKSQIGLDNEIINPSSYITELNNIKSEKKRMEFCYNMINNSDIFIYLLNEKLTTGIRKEINYALSKNKRIYKIKYINNKLLLDEMTFNYINKTVEELNKNYDRSRWILKTKDDYLTWFKNNPEAVKLIKDQFDDENSFYVPHFNSVYYTDNFTKIITKKFCKQHNINYNLSLNHGFIDPRYQEAKITCPFFEESSLIIGYDTYNLPRIKNLTFEKLLECRTIHRNMRLCKDHNTIMGAYPTFDFDIKNETKKAGMNFFTQEVFNEYLKIVDLMHTYMNERWNEVKWKLAFSGNGLYVIMEKLIYKDYDLNEESFYKMWTKTVKEELPLLLKKNGIHHIVPEKKYGWQRYFKAIGTFHLSKERVSIPLNKDESLDYKWINEMTKIEKGLTENTFDEIINKAGNEWR